MFELLVNEFFLKATDLRLRNDYEQLEKLLEENRHRPLCYHHKAVAMYEAICFYKLHQDGQDNAQIIQDFEKALKLEADSKIETQFLNAQIYSELAEVHGDLLEQDDMMVKLHRQSEDAFSEATELYRQMYKRDWQLQRFLTDLYIKIQYIGARVYSALKPDKAQDYANNALDLCRETNSLLLIPHCYIILAIRNSRYRSPDKMAEALENAKYFADFLGITFRLKDYFKFMDRVCKLNRAGIWTYKGKKLVEFSVKKFEHVYKEIQKHREGDWIDPIFKQERLM